ncbi:MAG: Unknown protein, partial [uncultured Sulfurovum sp.]
NIFNDGDNDGTINGTGIPAPSGVQLYVTLIDNNNTIVASKEVRADGSYAFGDTDGLKANSDYKVILSTTENNTTASLPSNWSNQDGEHIGTDAGTDGSNDGMIVVPLLSSDVVEVNFGINKKPVAGDYNEPLQVNPGNNVNVNVPDLNISDNEDNTPKTVTIVNLPLNGTLYYNGTPVTAGEIFTDFNNSLLTIDPNNGDVTLSFTYTTTDAVGDESEPATVSMQFDGLEIRGNIFNDGNNDNTVNGTKIAQIDSTALYATLLELNNSVLATTVIQVDGSYKFTGLDGIVPNHDYSVVLSTQPNATTSTLVPNWNWADGEHVGTDEGLDDKADGKILVNVLEVDVPEVNFGINEQPIANNKTKELQFNPGGTTQVSVPPLEISDKEDGEPTTVTITELPTNGTLYYNGVPVVLDANISDVNVSKFTLDPNDGDISTTFKYTTTDRVSVISEPATVTMPFVGLKISGNIFNDGDNDGTINGTGIPAPSGVQLYVTLIDNNNTIVASKEVRADGSYAFGDTDGLKANSDYKVILSTTENNTTASLPSNWSNQDGEHIGTDIGTDGTNDGMIVVPLLTSDIIEVNFGINKKPVAGDVSEVAQPNLGGENQITVPNLLLSDNEDSTPSTVTISILPSNGTLYYDGVEVVVGEPINDFNNSLLTVDPNNGDVTLAFTYTTTDAVGDESETATVSMSFIGLKISGNIFNDGNNDGSINGTPIFSPNDTPLYVTLVDINQTLVASHPVNRDGSYLFSGTDGIIANSTYTVILSTSENSLSASLPKDWSNEEGEHIGRMMGTDDSNDGSIEVPVLTNDVPEVNFGINEQPVANNKTEEVQFNPGGTTQVTVPPLEISDKEDGEPSTVTITELPSNGTLYYNGVPVVLDVNISDVNVSKFSLDPHDGDISSIFKYTTTDRVGVISEPAMVTMPFIGLKISGNIFNDGDNDGTINGTGIPAPSGVQLYVTLIDDNNTVVASKEVTADGSYAFGDTDGLKANSDYKVILSTTENNTTASLPTNWSNQDGEHIGTDAGTDGSNDGMIVVPLLTSDVVEVNFGINKKPVANDATEALQLNLGGNIQVTVPNLLVSDNEDTTPSTVTITILPSNGTLYYDGVEVVVGEPINNFNNTLLTVDPNNGDLTLAFTYTTTDAVGDESEPATVSMQFDGLEIRGNIFNDGNNDNTVNGTKIAQIASTTLYATLLDDNNTVMATTAIEMDGSYKFTGLDGIIPNTNYLVVLSIEANATSSTLVPNWNWADGEHVGTDEGLDDKADGKILVNVLEVDVPEVNFGVNEQPVANNKTKELQFNPGGTTQVSVPPLEISDKEDGEPTTVTITELPSNGTLYYDGKLVELNKPIKDINVSAFTLDPNNGDINVTFVYTTTDITGFESQLATVIMPFGGLTISGQVFMDGNGDRDVDGEALTSVENLPLYANLVDSNGTVIASVPLDTNGSYLFNEATGIAPDTSYAIVLSTEANSSRATLPNEWRHSNTDTNGTLLVSVGSKNVTEVNFGLNQQPIVKNVTAVTTVNPDSNIKVNVPDLNISDNEDGTTPTTITISTLPDKGILYYDGIKVVEGQVIKDFNNTLLEVDPNDANVTISFNYTSTDEAGFESEEATVTMPFSDPDSDGDGIANNEDLDDDNDGILDTLENNTSLNGGDSDADGLPDRLDLDADGDGILDIEESHPNPKVVDANGDGRVDSTTDVDKDGLMDVVDADDNNPTSGAKITLIDTDKDGQADFQDVDADNDGLSDLVEGGTDTYLDANTDGIIDNQTDTDRDGIADVVDADNGGTVALTPDTDTDTVDNYRDVDSDNDTLLDVIEIGGTDNNNDGQIDPIGTLISGDNLPDENNNGIPDILEIKLQDDNRTARVGETVTMDLLANDSGDIDEGSVLLVIPKDFNGTARLSPDGKRMIVDGEGEWSVDENGIVTFKPDAGFIGSPTSIQYSVSNSDGTKRAVANISIVMSDVAGVSSDEDCETYSENSIPIFSELSLLLLILLSSMIGWFLMRKD